MELNERLLDLIERQQLIIDAIFKYLDDDTKKALICEIADKIYLEKKTNTSNDEGNN